MEIPEKKSNRVVVTGLGVITSIGHDIDSYWSNLLAGTSGVSKVTRFDTEGYTSKVASEVKDFDPSKYMDPKEARRNDRYTQYAVAATKLAVEDGNLDVTKLDKDRFGVIVASGIGGIETIETQAGRLMNMGPRKVSPFTIPSLIANIASGVVAIELGARGPNYGVVSACASSSHAIGESLRIIKSGYADVMAVGGSEAAISPLAYSGFCSMKAMSTEFNDEPVRASRPFDAKRDGFVMGDGAGVLVLESLEHAQKRGARIYCELVGYSATCDAYHITSPDPDGYGLGLCFRNALDDAGIEPSEVDYINAHGTSTPYNDKSETGAVKSVFGDHAYNLVMSSTKSMTGHLLGAAGGIEAAAVAKAIETGEVPPTINYEEPDPDCDLNYVPNEKIEREVKVGLSCNLGFGGHNACLVFRSY